MNTHDIIKAWTLYGFNFSAPRFIEEAFAPAGESMVHHLKGKFEEAYSRAGMYGAFFYFYCMLDEHNKALLEEYVMSKADKM